MKMIRTLDSEIRAVKGVDNLTVLPKGKYTISLVTVGDWEEKVLKNLRELEFDDKFQKVKDGSGNDLFTMHETYPLFVAKCKFEVTEGPHKGRFIWHDVTTHPNVPWAIPTLLNALGVENMALNKLDTKVGRVCTALVGVKSYDKTVVDDDGFETTVQIPKNFIDRFLDPVEESF